MEEGKIRVGKGEGEGKGKEKQEQAAFLPPGLERTASGENQNTPLPLARAPSLLRSRTSQHVATETPPRPAGRDLSAAKRIDVLGELPLASCQWRFSCGQAVAKGIQPSVGAFPTSASSSSGMRK